PQRRHVGLRQPRPDRPVVGRRRPPACEPPDLPLTPIGPLAFAPDGKTLALADRDRSVKWLDVAPGRGTAGLGGSYHDLVGLHFNPGGRPLATVDEGGMVRLWDVAARRQERLLACCGPEGLLRVAFSSDGLRMATAAHSGAVKVWDLATGSE